MAITDSLTHHHRTRIEAFFDQHGLTSVYDLQLPFPLKNAENFENADLDRLLSYCIKNNIDPGKIVISESTLNVLHNTPFIHVHFPINLINHHTLQESIEQTPTKHFNYLAGNYHYDRFMLLQGFMENDLLDNMHWSAYRNINTDIHRHHHFTNKFLDFCKTNTPRTLVQLNSHNCYPEDILDSKLYVDGAFTKDANNMDNQIFSDSAITITVDTMANTLPKLFNSAWHDVSKETELTMFYTAKIIKPINTALLPPNLSAIIPKRGAKKPQNNICIPIAKPNSVLVQFKFCSNALKNNPNVCLRPMETKITTQAESNVIRAILLGIKFFIILYI